MRLQANYTTKSPEETVQLGKKLANRLQASDTILLYGDLGMGKTHFTKGIAEGLGIKEVIKSPTYAYVNSLKCECESQELQFYHYDLYRLSVGDDVSSIGLEETMQDQAAINVVEWADRLQSNLPDKYISVRFEGRDDHRKITIKFVSPAIVPADKINSLYAEFMTPLHICDHCSTVTSVARQLAEAYVCKGEIINQELLYSATMLHDLHRVCDFREFNKDNFEEKVTDEKWAKWLAMRTQFKGQHHADITAQVLSDRGFSDTAEVIRLHMSRNIILEPGSYDTLEKKIMYYADKRVKHREVVDLKERFRDGFERHGKFDPPEKRTLFGQVEKATFALEKELFEGVDIKPEDIV